MVPAAFPKKSAAPQWQIHVQEESRWTHPLILWWLLKDGLHNPYHFHFSRGNSAEVFQSYAPQKDLIFEIRDQQDRDATLTSSKSPIDRHAHHLLMLQYLLRSLIIAHK